MKDQKKIEFGVEGRKKKTVKKKIHVESESEEDMESEDYLEETESEETESDDEEERFIWILKDVESTKQRRRYCSKVVCLQAYTKQNRRTTCISVKQYDGTWMTLTVLRLVWRLNALNLTLELAISSSLYQNILNVMLTYIYNIKLADMK